MTWSIVQVHSMPKMKLNYYDHFDGVWSMTKAWQDNDMTNYTGVVYVELKLNYHNRSDIVQFITKTRQDNNVTKCKGVI